MFVILNTRQSPIAVQVDRVKAIVPNADDTACTIGFSDTHQIEVVGSLAKVRGKMMEQAPPAAQPEAASAAADLPDSEEMPLRRASARRTR